MFARSFSIILFFVFAICFIGNVNGSITAGTKIAQSKLNYLILEIRKIKTDQLSVLIAELNTYEGKISEVSFDETTRQLTVWYSQSITMIDVIQVVSKYTNDFSKISGTEMQ